MIIEEQENVIEDNTDEPATTEAVGNKGPQPRQSERIRRRPRRFEDFILYQTDQLSKDSYFKVNLFIHIKGLNRNVKLS